MKRIEKRMVSLAALALAFTAGTGHANNAAVLVEADKDTVTKFIYVGNSPNNTTHPAVSVEGKARGLAAKAQATDGSAALVGEVSGYTLPNPASTYSTAGVIGSGDYGVMGKGTNAGIHGDGGVGVVGSGATGVTGNGANVGVMGTTTASGGYAVWGNASGSNTKGVFGEGATGVHGKSVSSNGTGIHGQANSSFGTGVYGEATTYGTGVKGLGQYYGVQGVTTEDSYWPIGVSGSVERGAGVEGLANDDNSYGVYGQAYGAYSYAGYFGGDVMVDGVLYESSDAMLKQNIRNLDRGLASIMSLKPRAYEMKAGVTKDKVKSGTKFGLVAQEVQAHLPEIVQNVKAPPKRDASGKPGAERTEYKAVNYTALIPVLIKAIQEQQARIEALEGRR